MSRRDHRRHYHRTADCRHDYDEILQYNLKDRAGKPTDEKMPTLEEYLTAVRGRAYVDIDKCTGQGIFGKVADVVCRTGMMEAVFFYSGVEEGTREVLGVVEDANVYPWVGGHKLLEGLPRTFFVQTSYATEGRSPSLGDSVEFGHGSLRLPAVGARPGHTRICAGRQAT